jgi:hypothetical protein
MGLVNLLPLLLQILLIILSLKLLPNQMTQRDHNGIDILPQKFCTLTKYNLYNLKQTNWLRTQTFFSPGQPQPNVERF